jgi:peptidoglycan/LPS O-acetylase OafA/YrhL
MQSITPPSPLVPQTRTLSHIPWLDGLRATAALMVLFYHFIGNHGEPNWLVKLATPGETGVALFFVLSGFLITRILLFSRESPHYFRTFYIRRILRIFPLYFGFLVIFFFVLPLILGNPIPPFNRQIWSWFYLENLPMTFNGLQTSGPQHFWTLAVEEHFYLAWPLLVYLLPGKRFIGALAGTIIISIMFRLLLLSHGWQPFFFTPARVDALGFGAFLAFLLADQSAQHTRWIPFFRFLLISGLILLPPSFFLPFCNRSAWVQEFKVFMIPLWYMALIGFCIVDPLATFIVKLFSIPALRWLGSISYGLYVFHPVCFQLIEHFVATKNLLLTAVLCFSSTVAVAFLSYRFFESPILSLKRYFNYQADSAKPPVLRNPSFALRAGESEVLP